MDYRFKRPSKNAYYLNIARAVAQRSTCIRRKYGAVIVKHDMIVSTGYNGSPRGEVNCCDKAMCNREGEARYSNYDKCPAVHAEMNAIIAANREDLVGATLYLACVSDDNVEATRPCNICKAMVKNAGIQFVITKASEYKWD